jgi:hypothetical protein
MNSIKANKIYHLQLQTILSIQKIYLYFYLIKYLYALTRDFAGSRVYRLVSIENEAGKRLTFNYEPGFDDDGRDYVKDRLLSITDDTGSSALAFRYVKRLYVRDHRPQRTHRQLPCRLRRQASKGGRHWRLGQNL